MNSNIQSRHSFRAIRSAIALAAVVLSTAGSVGAQTSGSIAGTVLDEKGQVFAGGARIVALKLAEAADGFKPFSTTAISDKLGKYSFRDLPAGKYEFCVNAYGDDFVNTCEWGRPAATLMVGSERAAQSLEIRLEKGKIFNIDVKDDRGLLDRHEGKSVGGSLDVGIITERMEILRAELLNKSQVNRKYRVVVPVGAKFRVRAMSPLFDLRSDTEDKQSLAVLQDVDQSIESRDAAKSITLRISGLKAEAIQ